MIDEEPRKWTREQGLRLLEASSPYERMVVGQSATRSETTSIIGLVARQRRLMHAAYCLVDVGDRLEAQIILRSQFEFLVVQKWLQLDPLLHFPLWFMEDIRARMAIRREIIDIDGTDVIEEAQLVRLESAREEWRLRLDSVCQQRGIDVPNYPNLIDQAKAADLALGYSLAYRFDSQSAAHPRALGIEQLLELVNGEIAIRAEPPPGRSSVDVYGVSAMYLADGLRSASIAMPELRLPELDALYHELHGGDEEQERT